MLKDVVSHEVKGRESRNRWEALSGSDAVLTPLKGETEVRIGWEEHSTEKVSDRVKENPSV